MTRGRPKLALILATAFGIALTLLIGITPTASAHAQLLGTVPAPGAEVDAPPEEVVLRFDERVTPQSVRVLGADGRDVTAARAHLRVGDERRVVLSLPRLKAGAYVAAWRVVSDDGHPLRGAFTFRVGGQGDRTLTERLARTVLGSRRSVLVGALSAAATAVTLLAPLLSIGFVAVAAIGLSAKTPPPPALNRLAWRSAIFGAVATAAAVPLLAAWTADRGLTAIADASVITEFLRTRSGSLLVVRGAVAAAACLVVAGTSRLARAGSRSAEARSRSADPTQRQVLALVVAGGLAMLASALLAWSGHASTGRWRTVALVTDVVHVVAVGTWIGGLFVISALNIADRRVLLRFSQLVSFALFAVIGTGLIQSWRQLGTVDALTTTEYGRLLLVKVALVAAVVTLGARNRQEIRRASSHPRRRLLCEVGIAFAVIGATAALSRAVPGRDAVGAPVVRTLRDPLVQIDLTLDPAHVGRNELHVYLLDPDGQIRDAKGTQVLLSLASEGIEGLRAPVTRLAKGHWSTGALVLPLPGRWTVEVVVQLDEFTEVTASTMMDVR